jgi:hypothetical protein
MREPLARHEAAAGNAAREARPLWTEQCATHGGMDAVGAHQDIDRDPGTVRKLQFDAITVVEELGEAMPEMHPIRR